MLFSPIETFLQHRNTFLDNFFYDTDSLTKEETERLTSEKNPEGSIIVISPKKNNTPYTVYKNATEFVNSEHNAITRFTIAGVGSSDLGGSALARNVADYFDTPVGAIIAGYGMKDLMQEALGGWFGLGQANKKSYIKEALHQEDDIEFVTGSPDSTTLLNLLGNKKINIELLLSHSKGCLSVADALFGLMSLSSDSKLIKERTENMKIVTAGAVINLPNQFHHVFQFLGDYDWFGRINSRVGLGFDKIAGAWHHTNTNLPLSMSIMDLLHQLTPENEVIA